MGLEDLELHEARGLHHGHERGRDGTKVIDVVTLVIRYPDHQPVANEHRLRRSRGVGLGEIGDEALDAGVHAARSGHRDPLAGTGRDGADGQIAVGNELAEDRRGLVADVVGDFVAP